MILLDAAADLQAIAAWGSFIIAIVSAVLSGYAIFVRKKIQELTEIVVELKNSNQILVERFNMEKLANLRQSMPVFQIDHINENSELNSVEIFLDNIGTTFQYINTTAATNKVDHFQNDNTEGKSIGPPKIGVYFKKGEIRDNY